jgi:hypothetical protein
MVEMLSNTHIESICYGQLRISVAVAIELCSSVPMVALKRHNEGRQRRILRFL